MAAFLMNPAPAQAQTPTTGFQATYYQGTQLQGPPILSRIEPVINWMYDTGGSPLVGTIPSTDFSARWEGWYNLDRAGVWTFTYTADDGGRLWIDNELVVDLWYDHAPLTRAVTKQFAPGYHLIRVEYYQKAGGMTSQLAITPPGLFPDWMGEYFDNPYLLGEPRYRVNNADINFNWGSGSPDPRIGSDNFSVRWTRLYTFAPGNYLFTATADDGVRVWVGDTLAIDGWVPQQAKTYTASLFLNGTLPLRVEYFEQGGDAVVNLTFRAGNGPGSAFSGDIWSGTYFNNVALTAPPTCQQATSQLDFNWGGKSPGCGIPGQLFSVRWAATRAAPATGFYTIYLTVDDGARVFVDETLVLDAWREQPPTNYATTVYLNAGAHRWRVEYFQGAGGAQIRLNVITGVNAPLPQAPTAAAADVIVNVSGAGWAQGGNAAAWRTVAGGAGGSALWTTNDAFLQPLYNWGRWYPALPQAGNYEVLAFIPAGVATTNNARYWIAHSGRYETVTRSQAAYKNQWVSLGLFYFAGQGGEYVALSDVTYECLACTTVVWDAVKFSPR